MSTRETETVHEAVRQNYAAIARANMPTTPEAPAESCCAPSCCSSAIDVTTLATSIGYDATELSALPEGANMGLSCGNPTAIASLQPGEVVLDLGSGGGFDVFLAGPKVGPTGRVIGIDMTPDMLALARKNTETYREVTGPRERRVSPRRNRASPGSRCQRRRRHLQLCAQPFPGQIPGVARDRPCAETRWARRRLRHGAPQATPGSGGQHP